MMVVDTRRSMFSQVGAMAGALVGLSSGVLLAGCGGPEVPGKWQAITDPNSGFDIRKDGTFQGQLGPIRLNGKWEAKGSDVGFTLDDSPASRAMGKLSGKIEGDIMTLNASGLPGGAKLKKRPT